MYLKRTVCKSLIVANPKNRSLKWLVVVRITHRARAVLIQQPASKILNERRADNGTLSRDEEVKLQGTSLVIYNSILNLVIR